MNAFYEAVKGFTDLPIALISAIFGIISLKKKNKSWGTLFILIAVAAVIGAAVHIFKVSPTEKNIVWLFLYPLLFESVRRFSFLFINCINGKPKKESPLIFAAQIFSYISAVLLMFAVGKYDMLALCFFAVICLAKTVWALFKADAVPKYSIIIFIFLIPPILIQIISGVLPYAVVYEHVFIAAELFFVYKMSANCK